MKNSVCKVFYYLVVFSNNIFPIISDVDPFHFDTDPDPYPGLTYEF